MQLNERNCCVSGYIRERLWQGFMGLQGGLRIGEFDNKCGAFRVIILNFNNSIMVNDNSINNGQPKPCASFLGGEMG